SFPQKKKRPRPLSLDLCLSPAAPSPLFAFFCAAVHARHLRPTGGRIPNRDPSPPGGKVRRVHFNSFPILAVSRHARGFVHSRSSGAKPSGGPRRGEPGFAFNP